jgi:riboflavin kinase/FMN adenylyltransferase
VHRWFGLDAVPGSVGPSVVTLGNFDGVHLGHVAVLARVVQEARERDAGALAVTFHPHPLQVLHPDRAPVLITGLDRRLTLMAATGLDATLVQQFTPELAHWSPERYVEQVLVRALGTSAVVIGRDVRFGHRNSGDITTLRRLGKDHGFDVVTLDDLGAKGGDRRWSSTWIREFLAAGDVAAAAEALGRWHSVTGAVVRGDARGRELGFPTANLGPDPIGMVPADGVYAAYLVDHGRPPTTVETPDTDLRLPAAVSIGTNPQFDGVQRRIEAHVVDAPSDLDLYEHEVTLDFVRRLRRTRRFGSVPALVDQMGRDVDEVRVLLTR